MNSDMCPFCAAQRATASNTLPLAWTLIETRLLHTVGDVSLCAGLGAIVEPYVIAFPRDHYRSTAELACSTRRNLIAALDMCLLTPLFRTGSICVFEHGGRSPSEATACLDHCHFHVIDGQFDMRPDLIAEYPEAEGAIFSADAGPRTAAGYLFAGEYRGGGIIEGLLVRSPGCGSQYFRRVLAQRVGNPNWNWRASPRPEAALRLCREWREAVRPH